MSELSFLVVDGDPTLVSAFSRALEDCNYRVVATEGPLAWELLLADAAQSARGTNPGSGNGDGLRFLREFIEQHRCVRVILVEVLHETARTAAGNILELTAGSKERLAIPIAGQSGNGSGVILTTNEPPEILGRSQDIEEIRRQACDAGRSDIPVLLTGETGTGKDLVARAIHGLSSRGERRLVAFNCANAPPQLWESTVLGHRRGAFTGATADQKGLLEQADGSTLFLDELQAMDLEQQAKFLRVIESKEFSPLGSPGPRDVSVRFIVAMNRDPQEMMDEGTLRPDLFYRLQGLAIHLPPLRSHPEDIPILAEHFLREVGSSAAPDALELLRAQKWPGNVRELKYAVLAAAVAARGRPITAHELVACRPAFGQPAPREETARSSESPVLTRKEVERRAALCEIRKALKAAGGNRSKAARMLGIARSTLRRFLRP